MALTKAAARARVLDLMDATGNDRWDQTPNGEVDRAIGVAQSREWRRVLEANPYARFTKATFPKNGNGRIPLALLNTENGVLTGDAVVSWYRLLSVSDGFRQFEQQTYRNFAGAEAAGAFTFVWYQEGDHLMSLPQEGASLIIAYNHLPTVQHQLAGEASEFVFPDLFEDVPLLEAAAFLLAKGGAETGATVELKGLAREMREELLLSQRRLGLTGYSIVNVDNAREWGA